jgi:hypothetical protein
MVTTPSGNRVKDATSESTVVFQTKKKALATWEKNGLENGSTTQVRHLAGVGPGVGVNHQNGNTRGREKEIRDEKQKAPITWETRLSVATEDFGETLLSSKISCPAT